MSDKMAPGVLKMVKVNEGEMLLLLEYMEKIRGNKDFDILFNLFDQEDMFRFLDIFSNQTIRVPKRDDLYKIVSYIKIYAYIKVRGYDEKSIDQASNIFCKKATSIIRIYKKVDTVLTSDMKDYVLQKEKENG